MSTLEQMTPAAVERFRIVLELQIAEIQDALQNVRAFNLEQCHQIIAQSRPITSADPAGMHLKRCGIPLPEGEQSPSLLLHPGLPVWNGDDLIGERPTIIGAVTSDLEGAELVALHMLHLEHDGRIADVPCPERWAYVSSTPPGACLKLHTAANGAVCVCVGISDAWVVARATGLPVWVLPSAGALAAFEWPPEIRAMAALGGASAETIEAAKTLGKRATDAGVLAPIIVPDPPGASWVEQLATAGAIPADSFAQQLVCEDHDEEAVQ